MNLLWLHCNKSRVEFSRVHAETRGVAAMMRIAPPLSGPESERSFSILVALASRVAIAVFRG